MPDTPVKPTTIMDYAKDIAARCGGGKSVLIDVATGNLIVSDGNRGFAITQAFLDVAPAERLGAELKDAIHSLDAGHDVDRNGVRFFWLGELVKQGLQPCTFDSQTKE